MEGRITADATKTFKLVPNGQSAIVSQAQARLDSQPTVHAARSRRKSVVAEWAGYGARHSLKRPLASTREMGDPDARDAEKV